MATLASFPKSNESAFGRYPRLRYFLETSEAMLSSDKTVREITQAKQIWVERGTSTFYTFETQVQIIQSVYTFREPETVLTFLEENKFLLPLLQEAYGEIQKHFPHSQIFLEIDTDPENRDDQQLVAFIATNLPPKVALQKLKQFDEDWWLGVLDRAQGKLCINVEFE